PWVADWTKAQRLLDRQLKTRWPKLLNGIARQLNPIHAEIFHKHPISYYWSTYQHEWAIDVVFHHAADLRRFYPRWVNHAMTTFSSPDVMRFLGKHLTLNGQISQKFSGEVISDFKRRAEGVRVKHSVNRNSVKLYDKAYTPQGSVLRAEATIHNGDDFRVYRRKEGDRKGRMAWRPLRRGIADLHRRAQISHKAAARYLDAFATANSSSSSFPKPPTTKRRFAVAPPGSAANSACCGLTLQDSRDPSLSANFNRTQGHCRHPQCFTIHPCPTHPCHSSTHSRCCLEPCTPKIFAGRKHFPD